MATSNRIAVIGTGPMAIYLLKFLVHAETPLSITFYEKGAHAGLGMPYHPDMNADYFLANIFSREIPMLQQPLADWLKQQSPAMLARWDVAPDEVTVRDFYPRTLLGVYLQSQLEALAQAGRRAGHEVTILTGQEVVDIVPDGEDIRLVTASRQDERFSHVVTATGHKWNAAPSEGDAQLVSPWPVSNITDLPAGNMGILGSALSAVDVAVALGHAHGVFDESTGGLSWWPKPGHEALRITMVSKNGILPEADFYYPYPYEPLVHLTEAAVAGVAERADGTVLQAVFELLLQELEACDPDYLAQVGGAQATIAQFCEAYFARRQSLGAFAALRSNLAESRGTMQRKETIAWRYALLRGHEAFEIALPHLTEAEWDLFRAHLLPVFADCYAAVPHLSLERLAALRDAGVIEIVESGEDARFAGGAGHPVTVSIGEQTLTFEAMIDARGQAPAPVSDLPFPGLVTALADPEADLEAPFNLPLQSGLVGEVYCLSMPQVLTRHPFSQGLPNCAELAEGVAEDILRGVPVNAARESGRIETPA